VIFFCLDWLLGSFFLFSASIWLIGDFLTRAEFFSDKHGNGGVEIVGLELAIGAYSGVKKWGEVAFARYSHR
jgi:hypothetical protein